MNESNSITPAISIYHEQDIEHLIATASRLSRVESLSRVNMHPSASLRQRSNKTLAKKRFRTSSAKLNGSTLTLTISGNIPRFSGSIFPESTKIHILIDAEPPFCFASENDDLGAQVATEVTQKLISKRSRTEASANATTRTSLLELVAICDATCSRLALSDISKPPQSPPPKLYNDLWKIINENNDLSGLPSKLTLGLLQLAATSFRGSTISDPNPLTDSLLSGESSNHKHLTNTLKELVCNYNCRNSLEDIKKISKTNLEYLLWILSPSYGSRMKLKLAPPHKESANVGSRINIETKTPSSSAVLAAATTTTTTTEVINTPKWTFDVEYNSDSPKFNRLALETGIIQGYHGTDACNVWSCLQNGLVQMSGTALQTNGAAFGDGVYLAENLQVSLFYAKAWKPTKEFEHLLPEMAHRFLRFVFVCDVINDPNHRAFKDRSGKPTENNYLVVADNKQLLIRKLLIFDDCDHFTNRPQRLETNNPTIRNRPSRNSNATYESTSNNNVPPATTIAATTTEGAGTLDENVTPPFVDRSNGDDCKSRLICCTVVAILWLFFYYATTAMHAKRRNFIENL